MQIQNASFSIDYITFSQITMLMKQR